MAAELVPLGRSLSATRAEVGRQNSVLEQRMRHFLTERHGRIAWGTLPELDEDVRDLDSLSSLATAWRERTPGEPE